MRKITLASMNDPEEWKPPTLRTDKPAGVYARRSDERARRKETDTSQSREMQTEDLLDWACNAGWERELLEPYFADLGLSGTLSPDERPDMLRLFDDIDSGKYDHGTIVCYQESCLFRDETQIYYNQFIQKCKAHDVLVVAVSPYTMIYDFADEFLTEMFRVYKPHAEIVVYLFTRFAELAGDLSKLMRELVENPIVFPPIPEELNHSVYLKSRMMSISGGRLRTRTALESILTNRHYLGWRIVAGQVVNKNSHPAIIDVELFEFAFTTLTGMDLDGNVLELPKKRGRYYQRTRDERKSLLKDRIQGSEGQVYVKHVGKDQYNYSYVPNAWKDQPGFTNRGHVEIIAVETLDAVIVERLFFHIKKINNLPEYNKALEAKRVEKERAIEQVAEIVPSLFSGTLCQFVLGLFFQNVWFKGKWGDEYLYAILKEEWLISSRLLCRNRIHRGGITMHAAWSGEVRASRRR